jgi:LCP family protein required for cell wall assembly
VIVIAFTATTTAVGGLLQFKQLAADLSLTPAIKQAEVAIPHPGNPQTILVIGSDHRFGDASNAAHTDTMILVRLDPNSSTINVISVPRDLKVQIPEGGTTATDKINAAFSLGGPNLLVKVLKQQVFPRLQVSHIVVTTFGGFEDLVNAIGCVYADVDHRYYNNTAITNYSSINVQPGYQKLCGSDALSFVRFRHTDNDLVRNARQQDFIRWAKDQYGASRLISNRDKLLKIFGRHTQTDPNLHSIDGLINLFNLAAFSAGHTIKQVRFPAILLPCAPGPATPTATATQTPCYVTADPGAEARAFHQFVTPTRAGSAASGAGSGSPGGGRRAGPIGVNGDLPDGKAQAASLKGAGMPVYVPRAIANGSRYCSSATCPVGPGAGSYPRAYVIRDQSRKPHKAYRLTLVANPMLGQYYGVQGTTWQTPPLLDSPSQTRTVNGKRLALYLNGRKLGVVAWHTSHAVYWVSNTLTNDLTNRQMIAIAASLTQATP